MRIEKMKKAYDVELKWTAYPLNTKIPEEGVNLAERFAARGMDAEKRNARMQKLAADLGLEMAPRKMTYNSTLAHELSKWATKQGKGDEFHFEIFKAFYANGKNISDHAVLTDIAGSVGLSETEAAKVLVSRLFKDQVEADWKRSLDIDPDVVPTLFLNGEQLVHPQKYGLIEDFMEKHHVPKRS